MLASYAAAAQQIGVAVVSYLGYTIDAPIDGPSRLLAALRKVVVGTADAASDQR